MEQRIKNHLDQRQFRFHRPYGPYISECKLSDQSHQILLKGAEKIKKIENYKKKMIIDIDWQVILAKNIITIML